MKRILVRTPQWLGDAVVSTIFLSRLKTRFPESHVSVLAPSSLVPVFASHPAVHSVLPITPSQSALSVGASLRNEKFDSVYILPRSFRTALEAWWARIPERIGFSGDFRSFLLTRSQPYNAELLYAHRYLNLLDEATLPLDTVKPHFPIEPPRPENREVLDFFQKAKRPVLGLAPASIAPSRTWSSENFSALAKEFQQKHKGSVVLFGSGHEKGTTEQIHKSLSGPVLDTAGRLNLPELGWAIKQCTAIVANDSGLMHVASCFQVPTVVLFGASDPTWALPPFGRFTAIQHKEVWCVPCLKNTCVRFGEGKNECMKRISVGEVGEALEKILP